MENQDEKEDQYEQSSGERQQQENNDRNSMLPAERNQTLPYHSCQSGQDDEPGQNVE